MRTIGCLNHWRQRCVTSVRHLQSLANSYGFASAFQVNRKVLANTCLRWFYIANKALTICRKGVPNVFSFRARLHNWKVELTMMIASPLSRWLRSRHSYPRRESEYLVN